MATPKILRVLNKSLIITVIVTALSFIFPLVPCKTSPVIAEPIYEWGICKLPNPFGQPIIGISQKFYGTSAEPLTGLAIHFIIIFAIVTLIFLLIRRKAGKVLDLTKKK